MSNYEPNMLDRILNPTFGMLEQPLWRIWRALQDENIDLLSAKGILDPHLLPLAGMAFSPKNSVMPDEKLERFNQAVGTDLEGFGAELGLAILTDPMAWLSGGMSTLGRNALNASKALTGRRAVQALGKKTTKKKQAQLLKEQEIQSGLYRSISSSVGDVQGATLHEGFTPEVFKDLLSKTKFNNVKDKIDDILNNKGKIVAESGEQLGETLTDIQLQGLRDFRKKALGGLNKQDKVLVGEDSLLDFVGRAGRREMGIGIPLVGDLFGVYKPVSHDFHAKHGGWMNWYMNTVKKTYKVLGWAPAKIAGGVLGTMENVYGVGALARETRRVVKEVTHEYKATKVSPIKHTLLKDNESATPMSGVLAGISERRKYLEGTGPRIVNALDIDIDGVLKNVEGSKVSTSNHIRTFLDNLEASDDGIVEGFKKVLPDDKWEDVAALLGIPKSFQDDPALVKEAFQDALESFVEQGATAHGSFGTASWRMSAGEITSRLKPEAKLSRDNWPAWFGRATGNLLNRSFVSDFGTKDARVLSESIRKSEQAFGHYLGQAYEDIIQALGQVADQNLLDLDFDDVGQIFMAKMGTEVYADELSTWTRGAVNPSKPLHHTLDELNEMFSSRINGELETIVSLLSDKLGVVTGTQLDDLQKLLDNISHKRANLPLKDLEDMLQYFPELKSRLVSVMDNKGRVTIANLRTELHNVGDAIDPAAKKELLRRFSVEEYQLHQYADNSGVYLEHPVTFYNQDAALRDIVSNSKNIVSYTNSTKHPELLTISTPLENFHNRLFRDLSEEELFGVDGAGGLFESLRASKEVLKKTKIGTNGKVGFGKETKKGNMRTFKQVTGIEDADTPLMKRAKLQEAIHRVDADLNAVSRYKGVLDGDKLNPGRAKMLEGVVEPSLIKNVVRLGTKQVGDQTLPVTALDELGVLNVPTPGSKMVSKFFNLYSRIQGNMERTRVWGELQGAGNASVKTQGVSIPQELLGPIADDAIELGNIMNKMLASLLDSGLEKQADRMLPGEYAMALTTQVKEHAAQIALNQGIIGTSGSVPFGYLHRIPDGAEERIVKEAIDWLVESPKFANSQTKAILQTRIDRGLTIGEINRVDGAIAAHLDDAQPLDEFSKLLGDWREKLTGTRQVTKYSEDPGAVLVSHLAQVGDIIQRRNIYDLVGTDAGARIGLQTFKIRGIAQNEFTSVERKASPTTKARASVKDADTELAQEEVFLPSLTDNMAERLWHTEGPDKKSAELLVPVKEQLSFIKTVLDKPLDKLDSLAKELDTFDFEAVIINLGALSNHGRIPSSVRSSIDGLIYNLKGFTTMYTDMKSPGWVQPPTIGKVIDDADVTAAELAETYGRDLLTKIQEDFAKLEKNLEPLTGSVKKQRLKELEDSYELALGPLSADHYLRSKLRRPESGERFAGIDEAGRVGDESLAIKDADGNITGYRKPDELPLSSFHLENDLNILRNMELHGPNQAAFDDLMPRNWWMLDGQVEYVGARKLRDWLSRAYENKSINEINVMHARHLFQFNPGLVTAEQAEVFIDMFRSGPYLARQEQIKSILDELVGANSNKIKFPTTHQTPRYADDGSIIPEFEASDPWKSMSQLVDIPGAQEGLRQLQDLQYRNFLSMVGSAALKGTREENLIKEQFALLKADGQDMALLVSKHWGATAEEAMEIGRDADKFVAYVTEAVLEGKGIEQLEKAGFGQFISKIKERIGALINFLLGKVKGQPRSVTTHETAVDQINSLVRGTLDLEGDTMLSHSMAYSAKKKLFWENQKLRKRLEAQWIMDEPGAAQTLHAMPWNKLMAEAPDTNKIHYMNKALESATGHVEVAHAAKQALDATYDEEVLKIFNDWMDPLTRKSGDTTAVQRQLKDMKLAELDLPYGAAGDPQLNPITDLDIMLNDLELHSALEKAVPRVVPQHIALDESLTLKLTPKERWVGDEVLKGLINNPERIEYLRSQLIKQRKRINKARLNEKLVERDVTDALAVKGTLRESDMYDEVGTPTPYSDDWTEDNSVLGQLELMFDPEQLAKRFNLKTREAYQKEYSEFLEEMRNIDEELTPFLAKDDFFVGKDGKYKRQKFTGKQMQTYANLIAKRSNLMATMHKNAIAVSGRLQQAQELAYANFTRRKLWSDVNNLNQSEKVVTAALKALESDEVLTHLARKDTLKVNKLDHHGYAAINKAGYIPDEVRLMPDELNKLAAKIQAGTPLNEAERKWVNHAIVEEATTKVDMTIGNATNIVMDLEATKIRRVAKLEAVKQLLNDRSELLKGYAKEFGDAMAPGVHRGEAIKKVRKALHQAKVDEKRMGFKVNQLKPKTRKQFERAIKELNTRGDARLMRAILKANDMTYGDVNMAAVSNNIVEKYKNNKPLLDKIYDEVAVAKASAHNIASTEVLEDMTMTQINLSKTQEAIQEMTETGPNIMTEILLQSDGKAFPLGRMGNKGRQTTPVDKELTDAKALEKEIAEAKEWVERSEVLYVENKRNYENILAESESTKTSTFSPRKKKDPTGKPKPGKKEATFKYVIDDATEPYYKSKVVAQEELTRVIEELTKKSHYTRAGLKTLKARKKWLEDNIAHVDKRLKGAKKALDETFALPKKGEKFSGGLGLRRLTTLLNKKKKAEKLLLEEKHALLARQNNLGGDHVFNESIRKTMSPKREGLIRTQAKVRGIKHETEITDFGDISKFNKEQEYRHLTEPDKPTTPGSMEETLTENLSAPTNQEILTTTTHTPDASLNTGKPDMPFVHEDKVFEGSNYNLIVEVNGKIEERPLSLLSRPENGHGLADFGQGGTIQDAVARSLGKGSASGFHKSGEMTPQFVMENLIDHHVMVGPQNLTQAVQQGLKLDAPSSASSFFRFYDQIQAVTKMLATTLRFPLDFSTANIVSSIGQASLAEIGPINYIRTMFSTARLFSNDIATSGLDQYNQLIHYGSDSARRGGIIPRVISGKGAADLVSLGKRGASPLGMKFKGIDNTTEELWFLDATGRTHYIPDLLVEAIEEGALDTFTHSEVRNMVKGDALRVLKERFSTRPGAVTETKEGLLRFGENSELFVRVNMILASLNQGYTPRMAAQKTSEAMLDYGDKTALEKSFFNRATFFWTYPKKMIPKAGAWMLNNPSRGAALVNQLLTTGQGDRDGGAQIVTSEGRPEIKIGDYRVNPGRLNPFVDSAVALGAVADILLPGLTTRERELSGEAGFDKPISPSQILNVIGFEEFFPTEDPLSIRGDWLEEASNSNWVLKLLTGEGSPLASKDPLVEYSALEKMAKAVLPYRKVRPGQEANRQIQRINYHLAKYKRSWKDAKANQDNYGAAIIEQKVGQMQQNIARIRKDNPEVNRYG